MFECESCTGTVEHFYWSARHRQLLRAGRRARKERQKEEEEGEYTLREVRPRFRDPHPHTPQVLWHCLYECAWRTQTRWISVCLSVSLGEEPIVGDKAGLIAFSSASQREAFLTWITACVLGNTSHLSATQDPRDICLFFFFFFFSPSLSPPLSFFLSGPHRLSTDEAPLPHPLKLETWSKTAPLLLFLCRCFASGYVFNTLCIKSYYSKLVQHFCLALFASGSGVEALSQVCQHA